jgi:hypothetical protein
LRVKPEALVRTLEFFNNLSRLILEVRDPGLIAQNTNECRNGNVTSTVQPQRFSKKCLCLRPGCAGCVNGVAGAVVLCRNFSYDVTCRNIESAPETRESSKLVELIA